MIVPSPIRLKLGIRAKIVSGATNPPSSATRRTTWSAPLGWTIPEPEGSDRAPVGASAQATVTKANMARTTSFGRIPVSFDRPAGSAGGISWCFDGSGLRNGSPLEVHARTVLRDRRLRCGLDAERQARPLRSVDRQDERVLAPRLEDETIEVQGERRRPGTVGGGEGGLEAAARAEGPSGALGI